MEHKLSFFESMSLSTREARLIRSGVSSQFHQDRLRLLNESIYRSRYAVQVCDLRGFHIERIANGGMRTGITMTLRHDHEQSALMKRLAKVAVRSLYSLGIEEGEAIVATYGDRRYVIEKVTPYTELFSPRIKGLYQQHQADLHHALQQEDSSGIKLVMGMDPEFLLIDSSSMEVVPASNYLEREGEVGCDAIHMEGTTSYPIAELRPEPSSHPRGLLVELMHAVRSASLVIKDRRLLWKAGGMPVPGMPLGGHLHFSGIILTSKMLQVLDNYLSLPIMLIEDESSLVRRPRYGYLGDFRRQSHGGFEYRTLPSFLVSPMVTKGIVCLAYIVVSHYRSLSHRPLELEVVHKAFYEGVKQPIRESIAPLLRDIRTLEEYSDYAKYIEPLFELIVSGRTWDESRDIRPLWNVPVL
ncbi:putative amidoligase domain-containing protein [Paenibacillus sp. CMAA1364]